MIIVVVVVIKTRGIVIVKEHLPNIKMMEIVIEVIETLIIVVQG